MKPREKFKLMLLGTLFCAFPLLPARAQGKNIVEPNFLYETPPQIKTQRVIEFPRESLGEIILPATLEGESDSDRRGAAKGRVIVPPQRFSWFRPAHRFFQNPAVLNTFPENCIDKLSISASSLDDSEDGLSDKALKYVGHLKGLIDLDLDRSDATDAGAVHAAELPNLQRFSAFISALNGTCFKHFAKLTKLRSIDVGHNTIADENLKYFGDIPNLQYLDLGQNNLTDKGVKQLANCKQLILLSLSGNPKITDKSLETIANFKNLHLLKLQRTAVTAGALLRLKNLPLTLIDMPSALCSESDMKKLHQTFPKAKIALPKLKRSVDADTDTLFAPLH